MNSCTDFQTSLKPPSLLILLFMYCMPVLSAVSEFPQLRSWHLYYLPHASHVFGTQQRMTTVSLATICHCHSICKKKIGFYSLFYLLLFQRSWITYLKVNSPVCLASGILITCITQEGSIFILKQKELNQTSKEIMGFAVVSHNCNGPH